jgi:hypothetical protein
MALVKGVFIEDGGRTTNARQNQNELERTVVQAEKSTIRRTSR